ncbi:bifunctional diguanylate cyclase/phosphodiesterase [Aurantimonas sp. HBX-1]|uniref:putative bifunctional diguanylate cyclase/phosphodiesterase n=1 Tax=Aurantimonas sp. HBX-1 TaxID=2906072 RepID=UPI001F2A7A05|nr:GGDEF domain-containing phosphodiesterase [Aurantimonas sp. HBX-1]UIJ70805.1 EAL domain-containing protein [Aurantimonas sp. HBX-1]
MVGSEAGLGSRIEHALDQPLWKSADPVLRRMFEESTEAADRASVRGGVRAAVACFILFGAFDLWLFPDTGVASALTRVVVGLFFLFLVEIQSHKKLSLSIINITCALGLFAAAIAWLLVAGNTAYQVQYWQFFVFGAVFVFSSSLFFRLKFWISATCSASLTVLFSVAAIISDAPSSSKVILVSFFVIFLGFALYLSWQLAAERYVTFLNGLRARLSEAAAREKGQQLAQLANTDYLTGLRNRRAVVQEYDESRERWLRDGRHIGVLLIDVDYFKPYNDFYGHQRGDQCLVEIGRALDVAAAAAGAVLGRYGGEEFIAFQSVPDKAALFDFAESLRKTVEALAIPHFRRRDGFSYVTVSIGATMTRDASPNLDRESAEADNALYSAKAGGRNGTQIFDPAAPLSDDEDRAIADILTQATAEGLVSLVYQPVVEVTSGKVHAVESLMRLRGPDGTLISPSVFIPVAERTGAIIALGYWALRTACIEVLKPGIAEKVSVNVSAIQLRASGFPLFVANLLGEFDLKPTRLALEITEGADIASDPQSLQAISALRELGVEIWLDDFGTGYAGLAWLHAAHFEAVKIDHRFLHGIATREGAVFLQNIIRLLQDRGLSVIIEGVESQEQLEFLAKCHVLLAQGYYLGRPVPAAQVGRRDEHSPLGHSGRA